MHKLRTHQTALAKLCETHHVKSLYAFGSVLTSDFNEKSDIDLIVDFSTLPVEDYADNYFDFKFSLQTLLNMPVDLLEKQAIKNPYFYNEISPKAQLIYGR